MTGGGLVSSVHSEYHCLCCRCCSSHQYCCDWSSSSDHGARASVTHSGNAIATTDRGCLGPRNWRDRTVASACEGCWLRRCRDGRGWSIAQSSTPGTGHRRLHDCFRCHHRHHRRRLWDIGGFKGVREIWFSEGYERRDREPLRDEERWVWLVLVL